MRIDRPILCMAVMALTCPATAQVASGDVLVGRVQGELALPAAAQDAAAITAILQTASVRVDLDGLQIIQLHKRMVAKDPLSTAELRFLADSGDSLAAFKFATMLEGKSKASVLPDAVHYYSMAVYLGRDFGQSRLIALMSSHDVQLNAGQLKSARDALAKLSNEGDADAALALAGMYEIGWPFDKDAAASRRWLARAAKDGNSDAAQKLAFATIMPTDGSTPDPAAARAALAVLATSKDPGKVAIAQNLLARLDAQAGPDTKEVSQ
ncbi:MAG: hypothetical protein ABIV25_13600 [Paracoccaceae bacterium]